MGLVAQSRAWKEATIKTVLPKEVVKRQIDILIVDEQHKQTFRKVPAWVYKGLAVNRQFDTEQSKSWVITLLATGKSLELWGAKFLTKEMAIQAMIEVHPISSWSSINDADYLPLKGRVLDICRKHLGTPEKSVWYCGQIKKALNVLH